MEYLQSKEKIITDFLARIKPPLVWDLGTNTGHFAKLSAQQGYNTIAFDSDPLCVEYLYQNITSNGIGAILPLICDLTNPSPSLGWNNNERDSFTHRGPADLVMALALIHHLAIGNNVPFDLICSFFAKLGKWLILEFVPLEDPQVRNMLAVRDNIFTEYTCDNMKKQFSSRFVIHQEILVDKSGRTIFLMESR